MASFDDLIRSTENDPNFWVQVALQEFVHSLRELMDSKGVTTRAELAARIGVKAPTVSRWLNGNKNMTVASMCRMAFAAGGAVHIHVADKDDMGRWRTEPGISIDEAIRQERASDERLNPQICPAGKVLEFRIDEPRGDFRRLPDGIMASALSASVNA